MTQSNEEVKTIVEAASGFGYNGLLVIIAQQLLTMKFNKQEIQKLGRNIVILLFLKFSFDNAAIGIYAIVERIWKYLQLLHKFPLIFYLMLTHQKKVIKIFKDNDSPTNYVVDGKVVNIWNQCDLLRDYLDRWGLSNRFVSLQKFMNGNEAHYFIDFIDSVYWFHNDNKYASRFENRLRFKSKADDIYDTNLERLEFEVDDEDYMRCTSRDLTVSYAFETKQYCKLNTIIKGFWEVTERISSSNNVNLISFDGKPGTGKTYFCYYICEQNLGDQVYRINMMKHSIFSLRQIIECIVKDDYVDPDERTFIILEELDKYLIQYIQNRIDGSHFNDKRKKRHSSKDANGKEFTITNTTVSELPHYSEDEIVRITRAVKVELLQTLHTLADGAYMSGKIVFIINTNDLNYLFSDLGEAGSHFEALNDRIIRIHFNDISREETIDILMDISDKMGFGFTRKFFSEKVVQGISYRKITHLLNTCSANANIFVSEIEALNSHHYP
jgi:hypothetical protein